MTTKADLRRMVLAHLTVIDATETPDAERAALANLWIDAGVGLLSEKGLVWWDEDDIPAAVLVPLVRYIASLSPSSFGRGGKGYEAYEGPSRVQIAALKSGETREVVPTDYS